MHNISFAFDQRLDTEFLNSIYEDDFEHAAMVFEQFLQVAPVQMKEIEDCYIKGDTEPFRQRIHKLKPVFSFVGLTGVTALAEALEKKCKEVTQISEVSSMYLEFKKEYSGYLPVIENELVRMKK